jgi:hypothetical protein
MTQQQLIAKTIATIFENNDKLIKAAEVQELIIDVINECYNLPSEPSKSFPEWDSLTDYEQGNTILHNARIYEALQPSGPSTTVKEPGSNPLFWDEIPASELAHAQNTDVRLGRHGYLIDGGGTQTIDLTAAEYINKNYIFLYTDAGDGNATYTLRTVNGTQRKNGQFMVIMPASFAGIITFPNNAHQFVGASSLNLGQGDFAIFEGNVNGKTYLISSNKTQGSGGGGDNPFDQSLNTDDSVQFNEIKLTGRMAPADTEEVLIVNDVGQVMNKEMIPFQDIAFETIKMKEGTTEYELRIVDGELTLIPL